MNGAIPVRRTTLVLAVLALTTACGSSRPDVPEVSEDGLHLIEVSGIQVAYARPGATLAGIDKVILDPVAVEFASDFDPVNPTTRTRISDADKQDIKDRAAQAFLAAFREELEGHGYEIVNTPAPDVIRLTPALVDLYVTAPDSYRESAGRTTTFTMDPGRVTLVAELRDSQSGEVLARVFDAEAARETANFQVAGRVSNTAEANRIFSGWARILRERLDAAKSASTS